MRTLYNTIFCASRFISISVFGICLFTVLNIKYVWLENYNSFFYFDSNALFFLLREYFPNFTDLIHLNIERHTQICYDLYRVFVRNCQQIDLLLVLFFFIIIINISFIKVFFKKFSKIFLTDVFLVYIIAYFLLDSKNMLFLSLVTPIVFLVICKLNQFCKNSKKVVLLPIIGELFCIEEIVKYIFKSNSSRTVSISIIIISLIISNIICFLFPYSAKKDFQSLLTKDCTYSIRHYKDKMIISGDKKLIVINDKGKYTRFLNDEFGYLEDFCLNEQKKEMYLFSEWPATLLVVNLETFKIEKRIPLQDMLLSDPTKVGFFARFCCDEFLKKSLIVFEYFKTALVVNLEDYNVVDKVDGIITYNDGIIYNKYRKNFLISFYKNSSFLQEIDIENCKVNNIKADSHQGFIAISGKNKEIYVAFHQNGRIGVYDAETLVLKRKIKTNFMVKHITYDEDLNILIAPSYFTGYVDIFLMDGSDRLLYRGFVGYELREGSFDKKKENLYVCSMKGVYRKKINIKEIINIKKQKI